MSSITLLLIFLAILLSAFSLISVYLSLQLLFEDLQLKKTPFRAIFSTPALLSKRISSSGRRARAGLRT